MKYYSVHKRYYLEIILKKYNSQWHFWLQDLTVSASEAEMLALLPFWPSVYTKLATDTDRRVREQANIALEAVVKETNFT